MVLRPRVFFIFHNPHIESTSNQRYYTFISALLQRGYDVYYYTLNYPFKKNIFHNQSEALTYLVDRSKPYSYQLNLIQKIYCFLESRNCSYILKLLEAIHIVIYKIDMWYLKPDKYNFDNITCTDIIVAGGGTGGIIKIAYKAAELKNAKLIVDYRDPWTFGYHLLNTNPTIQFFKNIFLRKKEKSFLKEAVEIITVSDSLKNFFPENVRNKITVIPNGSNFNQDDILPLINQSPSTFNINYLGTIYDDQLFEEDFFQAFSEFYHNLENKNNVNLNFIGSGKNLKLRKIINKYQLNDVTTITDRISKNQLMPYLIDSSLFLHFRFKDRTQIITSKITEYLMFRKPILLPVSDKGDMANFINEYAGGYVCNDVKEIQKVLKSRYELFLNKSDCTINSHKDFEHLTRTYQAGKFVEIINSL